MKSWIFEVSDWDGYIKIEVAANKYSTALRRAGRIIEQRSKEFDERLTQYAIRLKEVKRLRTI